MQVFVFSFTGDSSGTEDAITLPSGLPDGCIEIVIRPPAGHAWTLFGRIGGTGIPMQVDEPYTFKRPPGKGCYDKGETIGFVSLDSGTGTFTACCQ